MIKHLNSCSDVQMCPSAGCVHLRDQQGILVRELRFEKLRENTLPGIQTSSSRRQEGCKRSHPASLYQDLLGMDSWVVSLH